MLLLVGHEALSMILIISSGFEVIKIAHSRLIEDLDRWRYLIEKQNCQKLPIKPPG